MANNIGKYFIGSGDTDGYTRIPYGTGEPATASGTLKTVDIYCDAAESGVVVKIFRDDGTNYNLIGQQTVSLSAGANIGIPVNIPNVLIGDLIGVYFATANIHYQKPGLGTNVAYRSGDQGTSLKSLWAIATNQENSLAGYIQVDDAHWLQTSYPDQFLSKDEMIGY